MTPLSFPSLGFLLGSQRLSSCRGGPLCVPKSRKYAKFKAQFQSPPAEERLSLQTFSAEISFGHNSCSAAFEWVIVHPSLSIYTFCVEMLCKFILLWKWIAEIERKTFCVHCSFIILCVLVTEKLNADCRGQHLSLDDLLEIKEWACQHKCCICGINSDLWVLFTKSNHN